MIMGVYHVKYGCDQITFGGGGVMVDSMQITFHPNCKAKYVFFHHRCSKNFGQNLVPVFKEAQKTGFSLLMRSYSTPHPTIFIKLSLKFFNVHPLLLYSHFFSAATGPRDGPAKCPNCRAPYTASKLKFQKPDARPGGSTPIFCDLDRRPIPPPKCRWPHPEPPPIPRLLS